MGRLRGDVREQGELLPVRLEDLVAKDHPVRVIDGFVDYLDLAALGFSRVSCEETGRPGYAAGDLLKLYIYGYTNQMRSSRRLEREAARNTELHWLIKRLKPSFKTIADFRRDHSDAIVEACRHFVLFCRGQSLVAGTTAVIDGTKIRAVASRKKVTTPKTLNERTAAVERKIKAHLEAMDRADAEGASAPEDQVDVAGALEALKAQREALQRKKRELEAQGLKQRVEGETEARLMRTPNQGYQVSYNAQTAVAGEHKLIVAFDVTNEGNDHGLLHPMASLAKQALGVETLTVVADAGYSNGEHAASCEQDGVTPIAPRPQIVNPKDEALFGRDAFAYDADSDSYRCPAWETMTRFKTSRTEGNTQYQTRACAGCPLKARCTKAARRTIVRDFHETQREAMNKRAQAEPAWMKLRRCWAEHPFGTMKWMMGAPRFLVRGLSKTRGELGLTVLAYNMKRVTKILGVEPMLAALGATPA